MSDVFDLLLGPQQRSRPTFSQKEKDALYKEQQGKCNGCGLKFVVRNLSVDHIKPFSKGGTERLTNLQLLCNSCNSMKGNGTMAQLKKRLKEQGITKSQSSTSKKTASTKKATKKPQKATSKKSNDPFKDFFDLFS